MTTDKDDNVGDQNSTLVIRGTFDLLNRFKSFDYSPPTLNLGSRLSLDEGPLSHKDPGSVRILVGLDTRYRHTKDEGIKD